MMALLALVAVRNGQSVEIRWKIMAKNLLDRYVVRSFEVVSNE